MQRAKCIICDGPIAAIETSTLWGLHTVNCRVCGQYRASRELLDDGLNPSVVPTGSRYLVSAWIKWYPLRGMEPPLLTQDACVAAIADAPRYTPTERMEQLLLALALLKPSPGSIHVLDTAHEYPYAWAKTETECLAYYTWLGEAGYTQPGGDGKVLTRKGWERATELQLAAQHSGRRAFVAMWFDDSFDPVWTDGLQLGIRDAGYEPYRIKEDIHSERIDFRIIAALRASRFVVADVSEPRTAVYYEAGFAEGLGKLVIWTCKEDCLSKLSFDTRQFRHIAWREPAQLRTELAATIRALLPSPAATE